MSTEDTTPPDPREPLGGVRETRLAHEADQAVAEGRQRFNLGSWEQRTGYQRDLDMQIGETVAQVVTAAVRGRFGAILREHFLAGISWDRARHEHNPVCACSRVFLGWYPDVGASVEAWIGHVMEVAGSEEESRG